MKILKPIIVLALVLSALATAVSADGKVHNWYFKQTEKGSRPIVFGGDTMPDKYDAVYMGAPDEKVIYLTFDAGYGNENLDIILDVLKAEQVEATFFILPAIIKYARPALQRMIDDGHLVANHTYSHCNMARLGSKAAVEKELSALADLYRESTGEEMAPYFRPPEGAFTEDTLRYAKELGYTAVFWSFAYADWDNGKQPDVESAKKRILDSVHNGEVMLLHPNSAANAAVLGEVIKTLRAEGFTFRRIDKL